MEWLQHPIASRPNFDVPSINPGCHIRAHDQQQLAGARLSLRGRPKGAQFACQRYRIRQIRADLDQLGRLTAVSHPKIDFQAIVGPDVANFRLAALQFVQHRGFQRVPQVRPSTGIECTDQTRVDRKDLAWIRIALSLGVGCDRDYRYQESVLNVRKHRVHRILGDTETLGPEIPPESMATETPRWIPHGLMTVAIARPRSDVCTSRDSMRAEEPGLQVSFVESQLVS
jgi:hypothetical protein